MATTTNGHAGVPRPAPYRNVDDARDVYMEKAQLEPDPIIRKAMERMVRAARDAFHAKAQLGEALRDLERHPDYIGSERAKKACGSVVPSLTLAWWVHNCAHGALHDAELEEVGDWLLVDADPRRAEATMRQFIETDKRDSKRIARKRRRAA